MYVRNKCVYMQSIGWDVDIITSQRGIVYISDLKKYDFIIPELGFDYFLFSKSTRERITKRAASTVVIFSNTPSLERPLFLPQ